MSFGQILLQKKQRQPLPEYMISISDYRQSNLEQKSIMYSQDSNKLLQIPRQCSFKENVILSKCLF